MKNFKPLYLVLNFLIILLCTSFTVSAKQEVVSNTSGDFETLLSNKDILKKFPNLSNSPLKSSDLIQGKEIYINYIEKVNKQTGKVLKIKNQYSKKEYLELKNKTSVNTDINSKSFLLSTNPINTYETTKNSWVRLTLNIYSSDRVNLDIYGYYEWLTNPYYTRYDIFGLAHDSHMVFYHNTSWSEHYWTEGGTGTLIDFKENRIHLNSSNTSNYIGDIGGVAYKFKLGQTVGIDPETGASVYPYGLIYVNGKKGNSSDLASEIGLTYAHEQTGLSISPTVKIPFGTELVISAASYYDKFKLLHTVTY